MENLFARLHLFASWTSRTSTRDRRRSRFRPLGEMLEGRAVPSSVGLGPAPVEISDTVQVVDQINVDLDGIQDPSTVAPNDPATVDDGASQDASTANSDDLAAVTVDPIPAASGGDTNDANSDAVDPALLNPPAM